MNEPSSQMIAVRAIEDIIQLQRAMEDSPNSKDLQLEKNKSKERVVYSVLKHDVYAPDSADDRLSCILKECEVENSFKCNEKNCKRLDVNGWEGDCGLTKYINPDVVVLENIGITENTGSDSDVKCWSSDSDVTVLRVRKEFRHELSNKVEWEEQRNLADGASLSSVNLDWENHSLINLAGVVKKEKDLDEGLRPYTIWFKTDYKTNSSVVLVENVNTFSGSESCTPEIKLALENGDLKKVKKSRKKTNLLKKKQMSNFLSNIFSCFSKKNRFSKEH